LKPLDLRGPFRAAVRKYPKATRGKIGKALQLLERDFGHPHRHQGLGIRKLSSAYFEIRVGLDMPGFSKLCRLSFVRHGRQP